MYPIHYYDINMEESRRAGIARANVPIIYYYYTMHLADFRCIDFAVSKISNVNRVRNSTNGLLFERVFSVTKQFRVEIQFFSLAHTVSAVSHY